jgi:hypothetical protein
LICPRNFAELCAGREGVLPARYLAFVLHAGEDVAMVEAGRPMRWSAAGVLRRRCRLTSRAAGGSAGRLGGAGARLAGG